MYLVSGDLCKRLQEYPLFREFYHRNDRALDTTFTKLAGSEQKIIDTHETQQILRYVFAPPWKVLYENTASFKRLKSFCIKPMGKIGWGLTFFDQFIKGSQIVYAVIIINRDQCFMCHHLVILISNYFDNFILAIMV